MDYRRVSSMKHGEHVENKILNNSKKDNILNERRIVHKDLLADCLQGLIVSLEGYKNHKDILKEVPKVLVRHFQARFCWINIFDEEKVCHTYSSSVKGIERYRDIINKEHQDRITDQVMQQGKAIHVNVRNRIDKLSKCHVIEEEIIILISPIKSFDTTVGSLFLVISKNTQQIVLDVLTLLKGISVIIGQSVYASRLQKILDSKLLKIVSKSCENNTLHKEIPDSDNRLNRMACIVAKTLFNEMCKAGFGKKQIINIVTEILSELQSHLNIK
jgi:transcriptional regulator with GAF, ATPase, and Fis domain